MKTPFTRSGGSAVLEATPSPSPHPSVPGVIAFSYAMALIVGILKATLAASFNEKIPCILALFGVILYVLGWAQRGQTWRAACSLALILLTPVLATVTPVTSSLSWIYDEFAGFCNNEFDRFSVFALFMFDTRPTLLSQAFSYAPFWGLVAGIVATLALRWEAWGAVVRPLRFLGIGVLGAALGATMAKARERPTPEEYLASRPVVATLFPASESFVKRSDPRDSHVDYPEIAAGPLRIRRVCIDPGLTSQTCNVKVNADFRSVGELDLNQRPKVVLREDRALGLWFVDDGKNRFAFTLDPTAPGEVKWTEITVARLLPFTRPPVGWMLTPVVGIVFAIYAGTRRGSAPASTVARVSPTGGPYRHPLQDQQSPGKGDPVALAWDLMGLAAVTLSLAAIAPWLLELFR